jgi:hypothetical protein
MKEFTRARTRRHLLRIAASVPFVAASASSATALGWTGWNLNHPNKNGDPNCFLRGTRISTPMGELPVEELDIGDEVCTLDGVKKIKWIGYNKSRNVEDRAWNVRPIRVARFAIDDHTPYRDLYLSPGHCLFLDDALIPVMCLLNDTSIAPYLGLETIEYYQVEFDTHEVIFAEGASVESYGGWNRESFANFGEFERLYGAERQCTKTPYAPYMGYFRGRDELKGLLRSLVSNVVDIRDPIQIACDRIAERAGTLPSN